MPRNRPKRHKSGDRQRAADGVRPSGHYWLYGAHAVRAALANPNRQITRLVTTAEAAAQTASLPALGDRGLTLETRDRTDIDRTLPDGAVHQGLAALVAPLTPPVLDAVLRPEGTTRSVLVFLDQVTDPQNVGAVLRSAAAFAVDAVVVTARHAPAETGVLAKAASGALEQVPLIAVANLARALRQTAERGFWVLGLDPGGTRDLAAAKPDGPTALVLGAEGPGLRRLTRENCDELVRLPMAPAMPSLNVSNTAAIAFYELRRAAPAVG